MYRQNKLALTVLTTILLVTVSCGCVSDDSGNKEASSESPLKLECIIASWAQLGGEWHYSNTTHIRADYPTQRELEMYGGDEPPFRIITIDLYVINEGPATLGNVRIGVELPENWVLADISMNYLSQLGPASKQRISIYIYSENIPQYLGLDTDADNFADTFNPNYNAMNIECYFDSGELKYPRIFSDGLEVKEYNLKVEAWADNTPKSDIEYTVGFGK